MSMKKHLIAAVLVVLPLVAGCQQRTSFDACVEYYEKNVKGKSYPDIEGTLGVGELKPDEIWAACK